MDVTHDSNRTRERAAELTAKTSKLSSLGVKRKFYIALLQHEEGVSVSCPELPGCHSQGATVEDALKNIGDAIHEYVEVYGEPEIRCEVREMEIAI